MASWAPGALSSLGLPQEGVVTPVLPVVPVGAAVPSPQSDGPTGSEAAEEDWAGRDRQSPGVAGRVLSRTPLHPPPVRASTLDGHHASRELSGRPDPLSERVGFTHPAPFTLRIAASSESAEFTQLNLAAEDFALSLSGSSF